MNPGLTAVVLTLILVPLMVAVLVLTRRVENPSETELEAARVERPWWGNPAVWIGVGAVLLILGVVVAPRLLGFVWVLLPFIWLRSGGRGRPQRPRRPPDDEIDEP